MAPAEGIDYRTHKSGKTPLVCGRAGDKSTPTSLFALSQCTFRRKQPQSLGPNLEEVIRCPSRDHGLSGPGAWVELQARILVSEIALGRRQFPIDLQGVLQVLINLHYCGLIAASIAVIGSCFVSAILLVFHQSIFNGGKTHQKR